MKAYNTPTLITIRVEHGHRIVAVIVIVCARAGRCALDSEIACIRDEEGNMSAGCPKFSAWYEHL